MSYEGWKNRSTWNVSLWLNNEYSIYTEAVAFMKDYEGKRPYIDFCVESGLDSQKTPDNIKWISGELDYDELDSMMKELVENLVPCTKYEKKVKEDERTSFGGDRLQASQRRKGIRMSVEEAIQAEREEILKAIEKSDNRLFKALGLSEEPTK